MEMLTQEELQKGMRQWAQTPEAQSINRMAMSDCAVENALITVFKAGANFGFECGHVSGWIDADNYAKEFGERKGP